MIAPRRLALPRAPDAAPGAAPDAAAPAAPDAASQPPSVRARLAHALLAWSVVWSVAVAAAVWLAVRHEVNELLDDTLEASAGVLAGLLGRGDAVVDAEPARAAAPSFGEGKRFAWQVVGEGSRVLQRSAHAPAEAFVPARAAGFSRTPRWRVYGLPLAGDGRMLYVAQTGRERFEAEVEVATNTVLAAAAIGLAGHAWLRRRVRRELQPLQRLSQRLAAHEPFDGGTSMGPAERRELAPVHAAIDELSRRLAERVARERAFTAHAAHALRTPLAGIDAQLAIALREAPPALAPRLRRAREATGRLQRVVTALLALFRSGCAPQRQPVDLHGLLARLPVDSLAIEVSAESPVDADPDLLAAALLNLLDNASRCGARTVAVDAPRPGTVRLRDDGPGVAGARRAALQAALDAQAYEGATGLGLMLADLVARAHGGSVRLVDAGPGFGVELHLGSRPPA